MLEALVGRALLVTAHQAVGMVMLTFLLILGAWMGISGVLVVVAIILKTQHLMAVIVVTRPCHRRAPREPRQGLLRSLILPQTPPQAVEGFCRL